MRSSAIKVGARTYAITNLNDADFDLLLAQKGVVDGEVKSFIDYDEQLIVVRDNLRPDHKRELVIHELIHAELDDIGYQQDVVSERLVRIIAARVHLLLDRGLVDVLHEVE